MGTAASREAEDGVELDDAVGATVGAGAGGEGVLRGPELQLERMGRTVGMGGWGRGGGVDRVMGRAVGLGLAPAGERLPHPLSHSTK